MSDTTVTALCLHPNDWDVRLKPNCSSMYSKHLYLSPEPCNWGPVWKTSEWLVYVQWVTKMKLGGSLPLVPADVSFEYNDYIISGLDVQSSWLWRYNYDFGKVQVRYSFSRCGDEELFLVINHKERGEHFDRKMDLQNDPGLLQFDSTRLITQMLSPRFFQPAAFPGYNHLTKQGADILGRSAYDSESRLSLRHHD